MEGDVTVTVAPGSGLPPCVTTPDSAPVVPLWANNAVALKASTTVRHNTIRNDFIDFLPQLLVRNAEDSARKPRGHELVTKLSARRGPCNVVTIKCQA